MNTLEQMFLEGMIIFVPEGNTKTLEELLNEPLDAIYITREQIEREQPNDR